MLHPPLPARARARDLTGKLNSDRRYVLNARRIYLFHDEPHAQE